jgi:hypothetical protein
VRLTACLPIFSWLPIHGFVHGFVSRPLRRLSTTWRPARATRWHMRLALRFPTFLQRVISRHRRPVASCQCHQLGTQNAIFSQSNPWSIAARQNAAPVQAPGQKEGGVQCSHTTRRIGWPHRGFRLRLTANRPAPRPVFSGGCMPIRSPTPPALPLGGQYLRFRFILRE